MLCLTCSLAIRHSVLLPSTSIRLGTLLVSLSYPSPVRQSSLVHLDLLSFASHHPASTLFHHNWNPLWGLRTFCGLHSRGGRVGKDMAEKGASARSRRKVLRWFKERGREWRDSDCQCVSCLFVSAIYARRSWARWSGVLSRKDGQYQFSYGGGGSAGQLGARQIGWKVGTWRTLWVDFAWSWSGIPYSSVHFLHPPCDRQRRGHGRRRGGGVLGMLGGEISAFGNFRPSANLGPLSFFYSASLRACPNHLTHISL